jgi:hypothetical protein
MIGWKPENERTKMKKNLLISYVVDDVDTELQAVSHFRALMYHLPQHYVKNFEVFDVQDVKENN